MWWLIHWGMGLGPKILGWFSCHTHHCPPLALTQVAAHTVNRKLRALRGQPEPSTNASRDIHEEFDLLGYSLPIDVHSKSHVMGESDTQSIMSYHVKPLDWVRHWMHNAPELLGGQGDPFQNFEAFWQCYKVEHPDHEVYAKHEQHLHRVVPLLLHGDEGRAVKRTNFMVVSMQSPLGSVPDSNLRCSCAAEMANRTGVPTYGEDLGTLSPETVNIASKQLTNGKGHTYLSRWLLFGVGGWLYKRHPHIIDDLLAEMTENLKVLFTDGFNFSDDQPIYGAVIGMKGDMDYHKKVMNLSRSYSNLGRVNEYGMCHACNAGLPGCPFEDFSERPNWISSIHQDRPWDLTDTPVVSEIPYNSNCPERLLQWDIFHVFRLGIARDIVGGILFVLLRLGFMDYEGSSRNLSDRLKRSHSMFSLWCAACRKSPGLRSFSQTFFNVKNRASSPWSSSKGSDSVLLLQWLLHTVKVNLVNPSVPGHNHLLKQMQQLLESSLEVGIVYRHGLWLQRHCARYLYTTLMTVLRGYTVLGRRAAALNIIAFSMKPKLHALHHIALRLRDELEKGASLISNPQIYGCDQDEDYLGRISRLSRRVGFKLCHLRVFHRSFYKISALLKKRRNLKARPPRKCWIRKTIRKN